MTLLLLLLFAGGFVSFKFILPLQKSAEKNGPDTAPRDFALQTDAALSLPDPQPALAQKVPNPLGNLYWGELHVHTAESFDARLFGTTLTIEDAYRFAKGEPLENVSGEVMQLTRPLDFVAITDHAEGFGTATHCDQEGLTISERIACWLAFEPNPQIFQILTERVRGKAAPGDPSTPAGIYQPKSRRSPKPGAFPTCRFGERALERCLNNAVEDWSRYVELADAYYEPGELTT